MAKNYLTPDGFKKLRDELNRLLDFDRPATVKAVSEAAAMGDRSENAEYIYGKRRLREIDRRLRFLQKRLEEVEVIEPEKVSTETVAFGCWVNVCDENGISKWYQIVGEDEIDPQVGRITYSSPLGRALLGKSVGHVFTLSRPAGEIEMEIIQIARRGPNL